MQTVAKMARRAGFSALFLLAAVPASAGQPVLSDPLNVWPLNFGVQNNAVLAKNNAVHIMAPTNGALWATYNGFDFTDMDASVTITPNTATGGASGLLFWATGPNDFFDFTVSEVNGTVGVYKHVSNANPQWQVIVPYMKTNLLKQQGPNVLRLVTKDNYISLYINGDWAGAVSARGPQGGGAIGIEGEGSAKGPGDYAFTNLIVSQ
jgi:hypothetical protein